MRVNECFKLLKPGMFVKTHADSKCLLTPGCYVIGEIGAICRDEFVIFTNSKLSKLDKHPFVSYKYKEECKVKGYDMSWVVNKCNIANIEILDELPKQLDIIKVTEVYITPPKDSIREKLAALCHDQWSGWMKYLFSKCVYHADIAEHVIPTCAVERWERQMKTAYDDLSIDEKNSDRKEADRFLKLLENAKYDEVPCSITQSATFARHSAHQNDEIERLKKKVKTLEEEIRKRKVSYVNLVISTVKEVSNLKAGKYAACDLEEIGRLQKEGSRLRYELAYEKLFSTAMQEQRSKAQKEKATMESRLIGNEHSLNRFKEAYDVVKKQRDCHHEFVSMATYNSDIHNWGRAKCNKCGWEPE